jgi:hypothetical protein
MGYVSKCAIMAGVFRMGQNNDELAVKLLISDSFNLYKRLIKDYKRKGPKSNGSLRFFLVLNTSVVLSSPIPYRPLLPVDGCQISIGRAFVVDESIRSKKTIFP